MSLLPRGAARHSLTAAAAVLIVGSAFATPAHADTLEETGTISGHVLLEGTPDAPPAAGTEVYLLPQTVSDATPTVTAKTDAEGDFSAEVVADEDYTVVAQVEDGVHVPRSLGGATRTDSGTAFTVAAGATLVLPEYVLPLGATISGHVETDDGASVPVTAQQPFYYKETVTDANGDYTIRGLDLGTYTVSFDDRTGDPQQWWPNTPNQDDAQPIVVANLDQAVTGIDADLRVAPSTNPLDSAPCLDRSKLTVAKATAAARAYLGDHPDLGALKDFTRSHVKQYLARCA